MQVSKLNFLKACPSGKYSRNFTCPAQDFTCPYQKSTSNLFLMSCQKVIDVNIVQVVENHLLLVIFNWKDVSVP